MDKTDTDKTDTEHGTLKMVHVMTIYRSYSGQAVNSLCETIKKLDTKLYSPWYLLLSQTVLCSVCEENRGTASCMTVIEMQVNDKVNGMGHT